MDAGIYDVVSSSPLATAMISHNVRSSDRGDNKHLRRFVLSISGLVGYEFTMDYFYLAGSQDSDVLLAFSCIYSASVLILALDTLWFSLSGRPF